MLLSLRKLLLGANSISEKQSTVSTVYLDLKTPRRHAISKTVKTVAGRSGPRNPKLKIGENEKFELSGQQSLRLSFSNAGSVLSVGDVENIFFKSNVAEFESTCELQF